MLIGREAPRINDAGLGALFGALQVILGRHIILNAAQLFEKPGARYPSSAFRPSSRSSASMRRTWRSSNDQGCCSRLRDSVLR